MIRWSREPLHRLGHSRRCHAIAIFRDDALRATIACRECGELRYVHIVNGREVFTTCIYLQRAMEASIYALRIYFGTGSFWVTSLWRGRQYAADVRSRWSSRARSCGSARFILAITAICATFFSTLFSPNKLCNRFCFVRAVITLQSEFRWINFRVGVSLQTVITL